MHTHTHVLTCCLIYEQQTPHPPHFAFSSPPSCGACSISAQTDSFKLQSMCCISDRLLAQPPAERHLVSSFHKQYCGDYFTVLIYFWLPWVRGLCLSVLCLRRVGRPLAAVCASHGGGSSRCAAPGSRACGLCGLSSGGRGLFHTGSVGVRHGLSCPPTCRTFLDPGPSPRPRRWQVDSHLLCRQGSPTVLVLVPGCPRASVVCLTAPASGAARSNSTRL